MESLLDPADRECLVIESILPQEEKHELAVKDVCHVCIDLGERAVCQVHLERD
jgi:hypothetical protein